MNFRACQELRAVLQGLAAHSRRTMTAEIEAMIEARAKRLEASCPLTLLSASPVSRHRRECRKQ